MQIINGKAFFDVMEVNPHTGKQTKRGLIRPTKTDVKRFGKNRKKLMDEIKHRAVKKFKVQFNHIALL